jgi:hypothetical protein
MYRLAGLVVYIRNIIPDGRNIPSSASLACRGGAMLNFRFTEFYEVRREFIGNSSPLASEVRR